MSAYEPVGVPTGAMRPPWVGVVVGVVVVPTGLMGPFTKAPEDVVVVLVGAVWTTGAWTVLVVL
jgi:hypothetical protein